MSNVQREKSNPFYVGNGRAMVSLGPLSHNAHCPYHCAFCYVQDGFSSYANMEIDDIINFLKLNREKYSIIYVSGDTDSFAHPRTEKGIALLTRIVDSIDCDITFSTRSVFNDVQYNQLNSLISIQKDKGYRFISGSSITRISPETSYLEPKPIPSPEQRIQHIRCMKEMGAITMLGLRPFLPVVNKTDYKTILTKLNGYLDIALGESFFFIKDGCIQKRVFPNGIPQNILNQLKHDQKMYFDNNTFLWEVWDSREYEEYVSMICEELGIVFSMHSQDALGKYYMLHPNL